MKIIEQEVSVKTANWWDDPLQWHGGRSDPDWYDMYMQESVKVKINNSYRMGGQPKGIYTIRSFEKTSPTEAALVVNYQGSPVTGYLDFDNPPTFVDKNYDRKPGMEFYCGSMPITARQAFNLFQTKLHNKA